MAYSTVGLGLLASDVVSIGYIFACCYARVDPALALYVPLLAGGRPNAVLSVRVIIAAITGVAVDTKGILLTISCDGKNISAAVRTGVPMYGATVGSRHSLRDRGRR